MNVYPPVDGDEIFYESASSLPWDERPFKQMYGQHKDEINAIVSSLQESLNRYLFWVRNIMIRVN